MKSAVFVMIGFLSSLAHSAPVVTCNEIQSGIMYPDGHTPKFYKISLVVTTALGVGPVTSFEVKDQDNKVAADVATTLSAAITRVVPFYETRETVPASRGGQPYDVIRKVYAVQAYFKSSDYELDWNNGGDYRYPDKDMTRDLFCTSIEPLAK